MKNIILPLCLIFSINTFAQDSTATEEQIFTVVEDMPCFPGCETLETNDERKQCTERNLLKYIYQNAKYPTEYRDNGIESLTVISFVINTDGKVEDVKIIRGTELWAKELKRVIDSMNNMPESWRSGMQRGEKVKVKYNLPIRINLNQN